MMVVVASGSALGAFTPNDGDWAVQDWAQDFSAVIPTNNGMNFDEAWDQNAVAGQGDSFGSDSILIAVLDAGMGFPANQPDLRDGIPFSTTPTTRRATPIRSGMMTTMGTVS
jgi:hypothetical protein